jgi:plastocyanin
MSGSRARATALVALGGTAIARRARARALVALGGTIARRARALVALRGTAIAIGVGLGASGVASAVAPAATPRTTAVGVGMREYRIALYRSRVPPGRVRLNMENLGEDGHDLRVIGPGATSTIRGTSPELRAGERHTLTVTLKRRGVYTLVCTIGDHEARGMVSRLRVVGRP